MQSAVGQAIKAGNCPTVEVEASMRPGDGYIHINGERQAGDFVMSQRLDLSLVPDERRIPPAGRIAEVEDIIGSVFVTEGKVRYSFIPAVNENTDMADTHLCHRSSRIATSHSRCTSSVLGTE